MLQKFMLAALSSLVIGTSATQTAFSQQSVTSSQASSGPSRIHQPEWALKPKHEVSLEQSSSVEDRDVLTTSVSDARAQKFKSFFTPNIDSSGMANVSTQTFVQHSRTEPLPVKSSGLIVIATAIDYQPHLSAHRSGVYTELTLVVQKQLLVRPGNPERNQISILYSGGTLETNVGTVIKNEIGSGATPLDIGKQYLLFLTYDKPTDSFNILRAWDYSGKSPVLLDQNGSVSPLNATLAFPSQAALESQIASSFAYPQTATGH